MKSHILFASALLGAALLSACSNIDTTGISAGSSRGPHPKTNPNASVIVTEFGDLQCPACRGAQPIVKQIIEKYGTQIKLEFKHFPLQAIHTYTMLDAEASECAADQGKFWEYEQLAYDKQPDLNNDAPTEWAKSLGLDMNLFGRCTSSHIKKSEILADYDEGIKLGVNGTPTFFVNGQKVQNTIDSIGATIDASLSNLKNVPL